MQQVVLRYEGDILRPQGEVTLKNNGLYRATLNEIEEQETKSPKQTDSVLEEIGRHAVDTGIPDLAAEHDHYLYGIPKRKK